jgi:DNA-binding IclR family transcriptional regulator
MPIVRQKTRTPRARHGYSAPALEKGIDIIEVLANAESGLTVSEISERLKRRMSELFRIIIVMEQRRWLQKDPETSRYSVTYHLLKLAHRGTPAQTLTSAAAPVMHDLSIRINQSCHLVVRSGSQGLVILRQENQRRHANLSVRLGAVIELDSSCSGQVLLAHMEPAELGKVPPKLALKLRKIAKRGYEIHPSPITAGVTDISYPVRGYDGKVVAALTIPYLHALDDSLPASVDKTRRLLEDATRRISQTLGWVK